MTGSQRARRTLAAIFGHLYQNEFATLEDIAISCRTNGDIEYLAGVDALRAWLHDGSPEWPAIPEPATRLIHEALYAAAPEHDTVVSGLSRHLRALLLEGFAPPPATSMMRNRGVADLAVHLVAPGALESPALSITVDESRELARRDGMRHNLIITTDGMVVVSGAPPFETMAHWHNVEFAARVECMRLDEASSQGRGGHG